MYQRRFSRPRRVFLLSLCFLMAGIQGQAHGAQPQADLGLSLAQGPIRLPGGEEVHLTWNLVKKPASPEKKGKAKVSPCQAEGPGLPLAPSPQAPSEEEPTLSPLGLPVSHEAVITSPYGPRPDPFGSGREEVHLGIDFAQDLGASLFAADGGTVTRARVFDSYGNCVDILHPNGLVTRYAHCDRLLVQEGQEVHRGQLIATMGATGAVTGPHLHFEVIQDGAQVDGMAFLPPRPWGGRAA